MCKIGHYYARYGLLWTSATPDIHQLSCSGQLTYFNISPKRLLKNTFNKAYSQGFSELVFGSEKAEDGRPDLEVDSNRVAQVIFPVT